MPSLITAKTIEKARADAQPGAARYEVTDTKATGLILRVGPSGALWQLRFRLSGKDHRLTLGTVDMWTLTEVRDLVHRGQDLLRNRTGIPDDRWLEAVQRKAGKIDGLTLAAVPRAHLKWSFEDGRKEFLKDKKRTRSHETWDDYRRKLHMPEFDPFLRRGLPTITIEEMSKVLDGIHASGRETHAANTGRVLSSMWGWLARPGNRADSGVMPGVMIGLKAKEKTKRKSRRIIEDPSLEDLPRIVAIARSGAMDELIGCAVELTAWTLQRRRAVVSAEIEDFRSIGDGTEGLWFVFADDRKRSDGEAHVIPLPPPAWACVKRAMALGSKYQSAYLFPQQRAQRRGMELSGHLSPATLTHAVGYMPDVESSPHDFRSIFGTFGEAVLGIARPMTKLILDHSEGGTRSDITGRHYSMHDGTHAKWPIMRSWAAALEPAIAEAIDALEPVGEIRQAIQDSHPSRKGIAGQGASMAAE